MQSQDRKIQAPQPNPETQAFWDAAAAGKLMIGKCTYSVMRRAPVPYAIAYVTLEEGVSMMTNIVDCDLDQIRIGQAVRLVFKPSDGGPPVPMFTPA